MRRKFDDHYDCHEEEWDETGVSAAERRELYVKWLSESWKEFFENKGTDQVKLAFMRCGMLNAIDGSEDHEIKVGDLENYTLDEHEEEEQDTDENDESNAESEDEECDTDSENNN